MSDRAARLQAYVDAVEGKTVEWSVDDCTSFAAGWVELISGIMVPRLKFNNQDEAHSLIAGHGGLLPIWENALRNFPLRYEFDRPRLGDVGVVETSRFGEVGVIVAHDGIALWRAAKGTALLRPRRFVKVWAIAPDD
ncbi:hypothetical protein [Mesorhizobium sp. KR1-2]|uniref:DUF6950 family protein n=1 Tax=Mesorhizobium sp. KR1-2 TaxID=3156609 RepID=UPI0032B33798